MRRGGTHRARWSMLALLAGLIGWTTSALPSGAAGVTGSGATAEPGAQASSAERVLVVSTPGLTWAEVQDHHLPNIEALLAQSALADLSPRGVSATSTPGAAYLTVSAGTRATSVSVVDGQVLALGDQSAGSAAGEIFERRTGKRPDGGFVALAWPTLVRANDDEPYDAVPGLLTETLDEAGYGTVGIGNADGSDTVGPSFERQVGLAVATEDGVVKDGDFGTDLLVDDPASPFGKRLDPDQVVERFREAWNGGIAVGGGDGMGGVVVEASDLARTMRYRDRVDSERYAQLRRDALESTDELVGRLLAEVDPDRDAVLLFGPYNLRRDRDLTVAALRAPGNQPGYLRSASTQRSGFLTLVDVGPTVLDLLDVQRPAQMEGRPAETVASNASLAARIDRLVSLNAASRFRERLLFPTTLAVVLTLVLVCAAAAAMIARRSGAGAKRVVAFAALANLALLPMSYLARAFPLEELGAGFYWTLLTLGALVVAGLATGLASRLGRPRVAVAAVLALVLGVLLADVMTGSNLSLSSAFGYSPTGNSRLYGISNYSFGQVAAAACLLATFLAAFPLGRARWAAVGLLLLVLVVLGVPVWGADVGGVLAFTPTVLLFAGLVWEGRVRLRHLVVGTAVTLVAVIGFGALDLLRPADQRSHLGRLFERVGDEGAGPVVSIVERKLLANFGVSTNSFWVAAIPIAIAFIVFLGRYPGRPLARIQAEVPTLRSGLLAVGAAALLGSLANDSGAIVGGVTLMVVAATLVHLSLEPEPSPAPEPEPQPEHEPEPPGRAQPEAMEASASS
jgi:hypothetical protein